MGQAQLNEHPLTIVDSIDFITFLELNAWPMVSPSVSLSPVFNDPVVDFHISDIDFFWLFTSYSIDFILIFTSLCALLD